MPRRYVFVLTNLCNLACTFCFQERKKRKDRMETEDWIKVIDQIPKNSRITLTGGEPLVFKGFDEIFIKANSEKLALTVSILDEYRLSRGDMLLKLLLICHFISNFKYN